MTALDQLSNNLANVNTVGFKGGRTFFTILNQAVSSQDSTLLNTVINNQATVAQGSVNESDGSLLTTGRELDLALSGNGYLAVVTPRGVRYTRCGNLILGKQDLLSTNDGYAVLGEHGPIRLGQGQVHINEQGDVYLDGNSVDRLKLVAFADPAVLRREGNSLLLPADDKARTVPAQVQVRQGYLEQSNVNAVAAVVDLVGILRHFEAIQKSLHLLMNDVNAKAIERLGP